MALPQQLPGISVVPQAPQVDPRLFASDPQGALMSAHLGLQLGTELASLQNLQGKLALEKAEIASKKATNALNEKYALQAVDQLPKMFQAQQEKYLADIAKSRQLVNTAPSSTRSDIATNTATADTANPTALSSIATSNLTAAEARARFNANLPQLGAGLAEQTIKNQFNVGTGGLLNQIRNTAASEALGKMGSFSDENGSSSGMMSTPVMKRKLGMDRLEQEQKNAVDRVNVLNKPIGDYTNPDNTYDYKRINDDFEKLKSDNPIQAFSGRIPGFKEIYQKSKDLRQTQLFLDSVPVLLKESGDPATMQKALDDFRDTKGSSLFKAFLGAATSSNVDPKTAARSALIDVIDARLGEALNSPGESKALKNSLQVQSKDNNESILAVVKQYRPLVDQKYNSVKEGLPPEAFKNVDDGSVFTPRSIGAAAKDRAAPSATRAQPQANYTVLSEILNNGVVTGYRVKLENGKTGTIPKR